MPSTAIFDYGRPSSITQMLSSHYTWAIWKTQVFHKKQTNTPLTKKPKKTVDLETTANLDVIYTLLKTSHGEIVYAQNLNIIYHMNYFRSPK